MKGSVVMWILIGMLCMLVAGCGKFNPGPPEKTRHEYSKFAEGKMGQMLDKHARLAVQIQQRGLEFERRTALDTTLDDLAKKREAIQRQIDELKAAKGQGWWALQFRMNQSLEELAQSYNRAFAQFAG